MVCEFKWHSEPTEFEHMQCCRRISQCVACVSLLSVYATQSQPVDLNHVYVNITMPETMCQDDTTDFQYNPPIAHTHRKGPLHWCRWPQMQIERLHNASLSYTKQETNMLTRSKPSQFHHVIQSLDSNWVAPAMQLHGSQNNQSVMTKWYLHMYSWKVQRQKVPFLTCPYHCWRVSAIMCICRSSAQT
jgi:hypothetical protein